MAIEAPSKKKTSTVKRGSKSKYIVRPGFHVLIQDGSNRQTFSPGEVCELTKAQANRVSHQIEEHSDEAAKRITTYIDSLDEPVED